MYRLTPNVARKVLDELIEAGLEQGNRSNITLEQQFCAVLHFYATGCYQSRALATSQMSQSTVSRLISKFSKLIADVMAEKYITFPEDEEGKKSTAER